MHILPRDKREKEFVLKVRALEKEHGMYLETSEWLNLVDYEPIFQSGVLSAGFDREEDLPK